MSVRPIDMLQIQQIHEVSHIKQSENTRPMAQQMGIAGEIQKNVNASSNQVTKKDDADYKERKFDAKDKSDNEYQGQKKNKDNKDGRVTVKQKENSSFDMKV